MKEFLMGNEAIAMGAIAAGVKLVSGYPGTPSTEVLETVAKRKTKDIYVEWSVNEKAAMEVAAGGAYTGARTMVTMKQVGLNVAADPLMSLEYIGVKGGMVIMVADDPGPISSQTEQDTRTFGSFSKVPVFDPSSVQEAYDMIQEAFDFSEKWNTPVFFRSTTRVSHGYASIEVKEEKDYVHQEIEGFIKDSSKWVIFPRLSFASHQKIEARNVKISSVLSAYERNRILPATGKFWNSKKGIVTHGISYMYTLENLEEEERPGILKISTPNPFPDQLALQFLQGLEEVLCIEELDPYIEKELIRVCGAYHLSVKIYGKLSHHVKCAGENTVESVGMNITQFLADSGKTLDMMPQNQEVQAADMPQLPIRPPVLCAGCPHRASFYAVKQAMKGQKSIFCGDIGCYTMGNAKPLDMTDTCLCMGAGLTISQGMGRIEPDTTCFGFIGDSTFFASGITGVVNAYYNQADITLVILDNSTTAMTGHQPHPGTGHTMMGDIVEKVSIERILRAIGLTTVETVDPLNLQKAVDIVKQAAVQPGVKAIIFKSPCVMLTKPEGHVTIDENTCINCQKCIHELGCPGLILKDGKAVIDESLCTGCGLCKAVCPVSAIKGGEDYE